MAGNISLSNNIIVVVRASCHIHVLSHSFYHILENSSFEYTGFPTVHTLLRCLVDDATRKLCNRFVDLVMVMYCISSKTFVESEMQIPTIGKLLALGNE